MSHYIHHIPGRLRIKNPVFKNNPAAGDEIRDCFSSAAGVHHIKVNALTGSVVVNYDPNQIDPDNLLQIFRDCEYVDETRARTLDQKLDESMSMAGRFVGRACLGMFMDYTLKGTGFSFLAALV